MHYNIFQDVFFALWVYFAAAIGNMTPILVAKSAWKPLQNWTTPIDFGKTFRGKRIFGTHKTWRGLVTGMIVSTIVLAIQQVAFRHAHFLQVWLGEFDFGHLPTLIVGPLLGFGALGGDAVKSFFKRQRGTPPGESWFPFDQIDLPVGALVVTWPFIHPTFAQAVIAVLLGLSAQLISSYIGFLLHLKDKPI
ncbi:MAG TPA: CDP-archaeol synthase [Candidatus Saccharimonadales bacterium]|nr:CDP-archaeol synthase [Candidatus Saccharimonadales bacterium]